MNGSSFGCDLEQAESFALYQEIEQTPNLLITKIQPSLHLPVHPLESDTRVILLERNRETFALPVDRIKGVFTVSIDNIFPLPPILQESVAHPGLIGFGILDDQIIILLDLEKTVSFISKKRGKIPSQ